jgi:hypothetical protein
MRAFGVLAIAPEKTASRIREQVNSFRENVLRNEYRNSINFATYDDVVALLKASPHAQSKLLGEFLSARMANLL